MKKHFLSIAALALGASSVAQEWRGEVVQSNLTNVRLANGMIQFDRGTIADTSFRFHYAGPSPLAPELPLLLPHTVCAIGHPFSYINPGLIGFYFRPDMLPPSTAAADVKVHMLRNHKWVTLSSTMILTQVRANILRSGTFAAIATPYNSDFSNDLLVNVYGKDQDEVRMNRWYRVRNTESPEPSAPIAIKFQADPEQRAYVSPAYNALFSSRSYVPGQMELTVLAADGSHPVIISRLGASKIGRVCANGDGLNIIFAAQVGGFWNVYTQKPDGTAQGLLMANVATADPIGPPIAFTAAGNQAAVASGSDIHILDVPSGSLTRTITFPDVVRGLAYNTSASRLAVTTAGGLYTVDVAAGSPFLREAGTQFRDNPAFSPSGLRIAVHSDQGVDLLTLNPKSWLHGVVRPIGSGPSEYQILWR